MSYGCWANLQAGSSCAINDMLCKRELPGQCKVELMRSYHHEHRLTGICSMQEIGLGPYGHTSSFFFHLSYFAQGNLSWASDHFCLAFFQCSSATDVHLINNDIHLPRYLIFTVFAQQNTKWREIWLWNLPDTCEHTHIHCHTIQNVIKTQFVLVSFYVLCTILLQIFFLIQYILVNLQYSYQKVILGNCLTLVGKNKHFLTFTYNHQLLIYTHSDWCFLSPLWEWMSVITRLK